MPRSKKITGQIVSLKPAKTAVVRISMLKKHPKYKKRYTAEKQYLAHNELEDLAVGSKVEIEESRPLSKLKRWKVVRKLK